DRSLSPSRDPRRRRGRGDPALGGAKKRPAERRLRGVGHGGQVLLSIAMDPTRARGPWLCSIDMGNASRGSYDPHAIEARRQAAWRERDAFATPPLLEDQPHLYIKPSAPFTSGNIHIGHVRSYSIGDAYARFRRARGEGVLFAFGFDAFGLPAELAAIASGEPPNEWVHRNAAHMTGQLKR